MIHAVDKGEHAILRASPPRPGMGVAERLQELGLADLELL